MALKQANRLLHLKTPLGEDLVLTGFHGFEGMSQLFQFELEMISDKADIKAKDIVAKPVTFSVRLADDSLRHFNGIVNRFVAGDEDENGRRDYRAEVVPWFWFLTRNADCRVFEDKSIKDIMEQIFSDRGFSDHKIKLSGTHPKRPYCVQYRETDFDFLCRLMEEEGVWYTFTHEEGKHTMLISDSKNDYFDCEQKEVDYPTDFGSLAIEDHIRSWEHRYEFRSGKIAHSDYNVLNDSGDNFLQPSTPMDTNSETVVDLKDAKKYELYDYPGIYTVKKEGTDFADLRMEAEEVAHDVVEGSGIVRSFTPGSKFKIRQHRAKSEEGNKFVLLTLSHTAQETQGYETGAPVDEGYHNSFTCIPDQINFRPACTTPKPSVHGVQSAIVVGDDEIPVDKYGRVKVRFQWLRKGKSAPDQSCWVRVSQMWAGAEWGGMHIPHKDQEVLVAFIDGDPDRPVITGRVYNEEQKVPLNLPDEKTKSIIRDYGDNQIIMEGVSGDQYVHIRQACGNEIILDGKSGNESIQIRDKFGNQIVLGAESKTISMYSPNHNSGMVLGQSKHQFSKSAAMDVTGGWHAGVQVGTSNSVFAGAKMGLTIGGQVDAFIGGKISGTWAGNVTFTKGSQVNFGAAKSVSSVSGYSHTRAKEDVIIDADEAVVLLGGKQDDSMLYADKLYLKLSYKKAHANRPEISDPGKALLSAGLVVGTPLLAQAVSAIDAFSPKSTKPLELKDGKGLAGLPEEDKVAATWQTATNTLTGILSGALTWAHASAIAKKMDKEETKNKDAIKEHSESEFAGQLVLSEYGVKISASDGKQFIDLQKAKEIKLLSKEGRIFVHAKKNVDIKSKSAKITFSSKSNHFTKGEIKQKNFYAKK